MKESENVKWKMKIEEGGWFMEEKGDRPGKRRWSTHGHTANMLPLFAIGPGGEAFSVIIDNTDVGKTLINYLREN